MSSLPSVPPVPPVPTRSTSRTRHRLQRPATAPTPRTLRAVTTFAVAGLLVVAGCSSKNKTSPSTSAAGAPAASSATTTAASMAASASAAPASGSAAGSAATIKTARGSAGTFLTDAAGRSVYLWKADTSNQSTCYGACTTYWPPVLTNGAPHAGAGATASMLSTTTRKDGKMQVTYNGHPLYYFAQDSASGDTNGQGKNTFGAVWWLVAPSGDAITAAGSGSSASASSSGGGGYGGGY